MESQSSLLSQLFIELMQMMDEDTIISFSKSLPIASILKQLPEIADQTIYCYIKDLIKHVIKVYYNAIIIKTQLEEQVIEFKNYETIIQKLEANIRQHIRVEQQQRLHIESLQQKIEEISQDFVNQKSMLTEKLKQLDAQTKLIKSDQIQIKKLDIQNVINQNDPKIKNKSIDPHVKALFRIYNQQDHRKRESSVFKTEESQKNMYSDRIKDGHRRVRQHQSVKQEILTQRDDTGSPERIERCKNAVHLRTSLIERNINDQESDLQKSRSQNIQQDRSFDCVKKLLTQKRQVNTNTSQLFKFLQRK